MMSTNEKQQNIVMALLSCTVLIPLFLTMLIVDEKNPITILIPFGVMGCLAITMIKYLNHISSKKQIPDGSEWRISRSNDDIFNKNIRA